LKAIATALESVVASSDALEQLLEKIAEDAPKEDLADSVCKAMHALIKSEEVSGAEALDTFVKLAEILGERPVLIIDEANKVLGLGDGVAASSSTLANMVRLTKQSHRLDVIMASSEYDYPYLLEDNGLTLNDISKTLFTGEVPPKSMWELLVTKTIAKNSEQSLIGMGENLARLLISSYGGHILWLVSALLQLNDEKESFAAIAQLNPISEGITVVLEAFPKDGLKLFRQMAETGFAPINKMCDPCVELIVRENIGGIVSRHNSIVAGVPSTIWKECQRWFLSQRVLAM